MKKNFIIFVLLLFAALLIFAVYEFNKVKEPARFVPALPNKSVKPPTPPDKSAIPPALPNKSAKPPTPPDKSAIPPSPPNKSAEPPAPPDKSVVQPVP
jgi:hypothetical protein